MKLVKECQVSFGGDKNVSKLDKGGGHTPCRYTKCLLT